MRVAVTCIAVATCLFASQAFAQTSPTSDPSVDDATVEAPAAAGVQADQDATAVDDARRVVEVVDATAARVVAEVRAENRIEARVEGAQTSAEASANDKPTKVKDKRGSTAVKSNARLAAVGDSVSTLLAVSAGAAELNPLITPTPGGLLLVAALKFGLVEMVDALPEQQRHATHRSLSAMWGAASVSNLLIATSVAPPVAAVVGIAAGWWLWQQHRESSNAGDTSTTTARASEDRLVEAKVAVDR